MVPSLFKKVLTDNGFTPTTDLNDGDNSQNGGSSNNGGEGIANPDNNGGAGGGEAGASSSSAAEGDRGTGTGSSEGNQDFDDNQLLEALSKKGINVTSLDELKKPTTEHAPTPEELAEKAAKKRDAARAFALQNGKATSEELDSYIKESSLDAVDLAYQVYLQDRQAENSGLTEQEIRAEFDELHFQYAEETDPKRVQSQKKIKVMADNYLKSKYGNVLNLEDEYDSHVQLENARQSYGSTIDDVITEIGDELSFQITDGKTPVSYKFKLPVEERNLLRDMFKANEHFELIGKGKMSKDAIKQTIENAIKGRNLNKIIETIATAHATAKIDAIQKGRRAIPLESLSGENNDGVTKTVTPGVKKLLERNGKR